jgi:hypothetical protein
MRANKHGRLLVLAVMLALPACRPALQPAPKPTGSAMPHVQHTPALRPLQPRLTACAQNSAPAYGLLREEVPAQALDLADAELTFKLGVPDPLPAFSAPVGELRVVVITHPDNPIELSSEELADLYAGKTETWAATGETAQLWSYPPGDDLRAAFEAGALDGLSLAPRLYTAPDVDAMLQAVAENPGAIGYVPEDRLTDRVFRVPLPEDLSARLVIPVMALSERAPTGAAYRLLACLQTP